MDRIEYYDRLVKNIVVSGIAAFLGVGNLIAFFLF